MCYIQKNRFLFEVTQKKGYSGNIDDVVTDIDKKAQEKYIQWLQECFPDVGIIAEEGELVVAGTYGMGIYFTIDPIDGTKAFVGRQSGGVGSMVALVEDNEVISAYVGNINTNEVYGYRPGSPNVWRITDSEVPEQLDANPTQKPFSELKILLRSRERNYSFLAQNTINGFQKVFIDGGSIGVWMSGLWTGQYGAVLLEPEEETPWDSTPIIGITKRLGYVFLRPLDSSEGPHNAGNTLQDSKRVWEEYEPELPQRRFRRTHETFIIHRNNLANFKVSK